MGSTTCPLCGGDDAYVGLNVVECRSRTCEAYVAPSHTPTMIDGAQWRATIARVRATSRVGA